MLCPTGDDPDTEQEKTNRGVRRHRSKGTNPIKGADAVQVTQDRDQGMDTGYESKGKSAKPDTRFANRKKKQGQSNKHEINRRIWRHRVPNGRRDDRRREKPTIDARIKVKERAGEFEGADRDQNRGTRFNPPPADSRDRSSPSLREQAERERREKKRHRGHWVHRDQSRMSSFQKLDIEGPADKDATRDRGSDY